MCAIPQPCDAAGLVGLAAGVVACCFAVRTNPIRRARTERLNLPTEGAALPPTRSLHEFTLGWRRAEENSKARAWSYRARTYSFQVSNRLNLRV